ncbi:hypothetical protein 18India_19 [Salmonella phage 18-India]|nr:hypothetical protein 18India_19 [Salmonella phage 18-India]
MEIATRENIVPNKKLGSKLQLKQMREEIMPVYATGTSRQRKISHR